MSKKTNCPAGKVKERLNLVGGQAVLEGVMMKAGTRTVTTCRKPDGTLAVYSGEFHSVRKKHKILDIPILRGVVNFIEMMKLSVKTLSDSADAMGLNEEEELTEKQKLKKEKKRLKKLEKERKRAERDPEWAARRERKAELKRQREQKRYEELLEKDPEKAKKLKKKQEGGSTLVTDVVMVISVILGLALSVFLFMFLPSFFSGLIDKYLLDGRLGIWKAVLEGGVKIIIFLLYLWLVSLMPDIKRTFMYHGAEHKSIACFESGAELTPEEAKKYKRFHPRCGTSFMFLMILLGIFAGLFVRIIFENVFEIDLPTAAYVGIRLLILPLVMGIGYEILMLAGKHDNWFTRMLSAPGLWVQRITTKEPTPDMLEVAIISIKCALRDDFPEFREFWERRAWEKPAGSCPDNSGAASEGDATDKPCEPDTEVNAIAEENAPGEASEEA